LSQDPPNRELQPHDLFSVRQYSYAMRLDTWGSETAGGGGTLGGSETVRGSETLGVHNYIV